MAILISRRGSIAASGVRITPDPGGLAIPTNLSVSVDNGVAQHSFSEVAGATSYVIETEMVII